MKEKQLEEEEKEENVREENVQSLNFKQLKKAPHACNTHTHTHLHTLTHAEQRCHFTDSALIPFIFPPHKYIKIEDSLRPGTAYKICHCTISIGKGCCENILSSQAGNPNEYSHETGPMHSELR